MESEFQRAARLKWPKAQVFGDGPFALYCGRLDHATLYAHWLFAATELTKPHSNWNCADEHKLIELKPVPVPHAKATRNLAEAFRD